MSLLLMRKGQRYSGHNWASREPNLVSGKRVYKSLSHQQSLLKKNETHVFSPSVHCDHQRSDEEAEPVAQAGHEVAMNCNVFGLVTIT